MGTNLVDAIREGTFPDSETLLSSSLTSTSLSELLADISQAKEDLNQDIRSTSKSLSNVDEWIARAAKVQRDIQSCRVEARQIIEAHGSVESKQSEANEASNKADLLQKEIAFTTTLQSELRGIAEATDELRSIEQLLSQGEASEATHRLSSIKPKTANVRGPQVRKNVLEYEADIEKRARSILEANLDALVTTHQDERHTVIQIRRSSGSDHSRTLHGLQALNALDGAARPLADKIEAFAVQILRNESKASSAVNDASEFRVTFNDSQSTASNTISFAQEYMQFLHSQLPQELLEPITHTVLPSIVSILITEWLNPGIPTEVSRLDQFDTVREDASALAQIIDSYGWPGAVQLAQWLEQSPRFWLTKRKAETLDSVRRIFVTSKGTTHQVERVERQKASTLDEPATKQTTDDWNSSWDDEKEQGTAIASAEDTSGWGFDDDNDEGKGDQHEAADDDGGDAWGWNEDDDKTDPNDKIDQTKRPTNDDSKRPNGGHVTDSQELVLSEYYSITDVPDHLVEVLGRDIQDSLLLQEHKYASLSEIPASSGLLALPTLALAMFRATAATHYTSTPNLGNMNLYNDAIYIADKLNTMNPPSGMQTIASDSAAMLKFARSAYAREMDTQRTILNDLLDGAQGFSNCTQFPYSSEIENAVLATIDRLRAVHASWQGVLSTSALLQSTGALLSTTIAKFILDVCELEDISEAQSHRLASFTAKFTSLEDLFLATPPAGSAAGSEAVPMTAVYVSNWLKLQYLAQILDSSLVDIKYLWTEGELSLEFTAEEVIDLVKALFAESGHRRAAIAAIKA